MLRRPRPRPRGLAAPRSSAAKPAPPWRNIAFSKSIQKLNRAKHPKTSCNLLTAHTCYIDVSFNVEVFFYCIEIKCCCAERSEFVRGAGRGGAPTWERGAKYKPRGRGLGQRNTSPHYSNIQCQYTK